MSKKLLALSIFIGSLLSGCSEKYEMNNPLNLAGNRQMAVGFKTLKGDPTSTTAAEYLSRLAQKAVAASYGSKVIEVRLEPNAPLESPEHLYQIGKFEIDDLFVVEGTLKGAFEIPSASSEPVAAETSEPAPAETVAIESDSYADFSVSIFNGSNLRAVNIFNFRVPTKPTDTFEASFVTAFKKAGQSAFPNPNIYPKSDPRHYADLLYTFSESREKGNSSPLSCENAQERLRYYAAAKTLYDVATARGTGKVVGGQSESHQLATRQSESSAKTKIVEECAADQAKTYQIQIDYGSINPSNQVYLQKAFELANFDPIFKQYTSKPVVLKFQVEESGQLSLFVELRFDQAKYRGWTAGRIPTKLKNFQILSLDPYYAIMQKLVLFKNSLPEAAPFALRSAFENMKIMLNLKTLINGEIGFAVDGKYIKDQKRLVMAYPNTIYISIPGFDTRNVVNRDPEIFQDKGWIALGNCKTIEGQRTEDGLLYDFFGFLCQ